MLARRWRGIRRSGVAHLGISAASLGLWAVSRWDYAGIVACTLALMGAVDIAVRSWRTLRLASVARRPDEVQAVRVTRHYHRRYKRLDIEVAALWPAGTETYPEPPFSVRVEDVGALPERGEVLVYGRLGQGRHVLLVCGGEIVWPVRRVRTGLRPRGLAPYPYDDD